MDRNRLTSLLFLFLVVVALMVFVNDRVVKYTVRTKDDCVRDQLVLLGSNPPKSSAHQGSRSSDSSELKQLREKIKIVEGETSTVQQQLREARERVNKLELKLYESEKRLKIFQGSDKPVPPRNGSFPNFIIMGTWKGGTTSLHKMLQNHPNVCLALGEVNFFSRPTLRNIGLNLYYKFFERCLGDPKKQHKKLTKGSHIKYSTPDDIVVGEKSPTYLWNCKSVCPQIRKVNPDVKLIVSLRNPIDRAFSNWYMDWCKGVFNGTFEEFLNRSSKSLEAGVYINQMKVLHQHFPKKQIFVIKTEDFFTQPRVLISQLENYLGVHHYNFTDEDIRTYGSSPKCQKKFGSRPSVSPELMPRLLEYFKKPNAELQAFMTKEYGWGPLGWENVHSYQPAENTEDNDDDSEEDDEDEELSEATEDNEDEEESLKNDRIR